MQELHEAWIALQFGGAMVYPLLLLAIIALILTIDKVFVYWRYARVPQQLYDLVETFGFAWTELEQQLRAVRMGNYYGRFIRVIFDNRGKPAWWVESRAADEAQVIEIGRAHV